MTNAEAHTIIKNRRNDLDMITDSSNSQAQFVRTGSTFLTDEEVAELREALQTVIIGIHEDEIVVA